MKVTKEELLAAIEGSSSMSEAGAKLPINFKTFITYEMTKGEQVEKFAHNEKIRKEFENGE